MWQPWKVKRVNLKTVAKQVDNAFVDLFVTAPTVQKQDGLTVPADGIIYFGIVNIYFQTATPQSIFSYIITKIYQNLKIYFYIF